MEGERRRRRKRKRWHFHLSSSQLISSNTDAVRALLAPVFHGKHAEESIARGTIDFEPQAVEMLQCGIDEGHVPMLRLREERGKGGE